MITDEARTILEAAATSKTGNVRITRKLGKYILNSGTKKWNVDVNQFPRYLNMLDGIEKIGFLIFITSNTETPNGRLISDWHWYRISREGRDYISELESED